MDMKMAVRGTIAFKWIPPNELPVEETSMII
jgi:hypothetical protein